MNELEEILCILGAKEVVIVRMKKQIDDLKAQLEEARRPADPD